MEKNKLAVIELPVEQLHSHPQNPRKELGDLSELADSIKREKDWNKHLRELNRRAQP